MNYEYLLRRRSVEAFQMTKERRADNSEWPEWLHKAWNMEEGSVGSLYLKWDNGSTKAELMIATRTGNYTVNWGNYIIYNDGQLTLTTRAEHFEHLYELVEK